MLTSAVTGRPLLSQKQIDSIAHSAYAPIALWSGAVSSGKTIASLIAFLGAVGDAPTQGLIVIVGRTLQTIERNILDPLMSPELFGELSQHVHHTQGASTATILGRKVHLVGASDTRAEGRIRGATVSLAYVDEATLVPQSFWMMLLSRLRVPRARLLATTNPDGPAHWLRQDFILRARQVGMALFDFKLKDNPSLTPEYIRGLEAQYVGLWKRRFLDGEWCLAEGAVYDMWDEDRHIIRGPLPTNLIAYPCVGVDYGTTNPFSAHLVAVQHAVPGPHGAPGTPARLVVLREHRHDPKHHARKLTDADHSHALRQWMAGGPTPKWVAVDPSAASFKLQLFRDRVTNVMDAKNAVVDGIRLVASLFATDRLVVHESCTGLINEIPGYSWDPKAAEKGEDKPVKTDDHGCDSTRYAVASTETLWRPWIPRGREVANATASAR